MEFGRTGGDGGTSYDFLLGRDTPSIVLYTDGQLLISGEHYGTRDWYLQKTLTVPQMCALLERIRATGFFRVEGTGQSSPDPIYQTPEYYGGGAGGYMLRVNGKPSKWVHIYGPAVENLVPEVNAAYQLFRSYHPTGMKPFVPDRVMLQVERQPGEEWWLTPPPPQPWPAELPSLAKLLEGQPERPKMILEKQSAARIARMMRLPGSGSFTENGKTFFIVGRPLLPHETLDYFSVFRWEETSFDLPFKCGTS